MKTTLDEAVRIRLLRLNATVQGLATGLIAATGLFLATNWLVVKGGPAIGPHLGLLGQYFIGYEVTFAGSIIGFAYAFVVGFAAGFSVSWIYNAVAARRYPAPA